MNEGAPGPPVRSRDYDGVLAAGAIAVAAACILLLRSAPAESRTAPHETSTPVATLTFVVSEVRRRPAESLVWDTLQLGAPVFERDSIFVPPRASASFSLDGGGRLDVEENSLVVLEPPALDSPAAGGAQVALQKGAVLGTSGGQSLIIRSGDGVTELTKGAAVRVDLQAPGTTRVDVLAGEALVHTPEGKQVLPPGAAGTLGKEGTFLPLRPFTVTLEAPARDERVLFSGQPPPLELRWTANLPGELRLQVAKDRLFHDIHATFPLSGGAHTLTLQEGGLYWWRVVDSEGTAQSETRKLSLVAAVAPVLLSPRAKERFSSRSVPLAWTAAPAAVGYEVEIATDPALHHIIYTRELDVTQLWWKEDVPEGTYYWRVCARVEEPDVRPCSRVDSFDLLTEPLPAAPVLLKPEIEIEHGSRGKP